MKLRLLMFFGLLTSLFVSVQAQTSSNEVVFTDADGKVLAPNAMLVLNKVRDGAFGGKEISTRLFIHNNSGKNQTVTLSCTISGIKDGNVKVCALGECSLKEEDGTYEVGSKKLSTTSRNEEISVERSFESNEKCTVKLQLTTKEAGADGGEVKKAGPVITLNINTDPTGIASASSQNGGTYDAFNVRGVLLHKQLTPLSELPKGIYIVKQKDAKGIVSTRKYIVR